MHGDRRATDLGRFFGFGKRVQAILHPRGHGFFPRTYFACKTLKAQVRVFDPSVTPSARSRALTPALSEKEVDVARELLKQPNEENDYL